MNVSPRSTKTAGGIAVGPGIHVAMAALLASTAVGVWAAPERGSALVTAQTIAAGAAVYAGIAWAGRRRAGVVPAVTDAAGARDDGRRIVFPDAVPPSRLRRQAAGHPCPGAPDQRPIPAVGHLDALPEQHRHAARWGLRRCARPRPQSTGRAGHPGDCGGGCRPARRGAGSGCVTRFPPGGGGGRGRGPVGVVPPAGTSAAFRGRLGPRPGSGRPWCGDVVEHAVVDGGGGARRPARSPRRLPRRPDAAARRPVHRHRRRRSICGWPFEVRAAHPGAVSDLLPQPRARDLARARAARPRLVVGAGGGDGRRCGGRRTRRPWLAVSWRVDRAAGGAPARVERRPPVGRSPGRGCRSSSSLDC